jgi:hypothetical protein
MISLRKLFPRLVIGWSLLCFSFPASAQQPSKSQTANHQADVSDSELRAFVKAYVDNQKIRQKYEPPLKNATDPEKNKQIQDEANVELKKSLAKQNLSVENYNRIYNLVNSDAQLREKTLKLVEEERKGS